MTLRLRHDETLARVQRKLKVLGQGLEGRRRSLCLALAVDIDCQIVPLRVRLAKLGKGVARSPCVYVVVCNSKARRTVSQSYADAVLVASVVGAATDVAGVTFRAAVLRADAFFAVTAVFAEAFVAAFFTPAVFFVDAAVFLAPTFLLTAPTLRAAFDWVAAPASDASDLSAGACPIRNLVRSFADANHFGAGPRPLQVAPDFGS